MTRPADAIRQWTPSARQFREQESGKLKLQPMDAPRDPWVRPTLICVAIVVGYFVLQYLR